MLGETRQFVLAVFGKKPKHQCMTQQLSPSANTPSDDTHERNTRNALHVHDQVILSLFVCANLALTEKLFCWRCCT